MAREQLASYPASLTANTIKKWSVLFFLYNVCTLISLNASMLLLLLLHRCVCVWSGDEFIPFCGDRLFMTS